MAGASSYLVVRRRVTAGRDLGTLSRAEGPRADVRLGPSLAPLGRFLPVVLRSAHQALPSAAMCRSIKTLRGSTEPVSDEEMRAAARQYVRKLSGYRTPSRANEAVFEAAVDEVAVATRALLDGLVVRGAQVRSEAARPLPDRLGGPKLGSGARSLPCRLAFDWSGVSVTTGTGPRPAPRHRHRRTVRGSRPCRPRRASTAPGSRAGSAAVELKRPPMTTTASSSAMTEPWAMPMATGVSASMVAMAVMRIGRTRTRRRRRARRRRRRRLARRCSTKSSSTMALVTTMPMSMSMPTMALMPDGVTADGQGREGADGRQRQAEEDDEGRDERAEGQHHHDVDHEDGEAHGEEERVEGLVHLGGGTGEGRDSTVSGISPSSRSAVDDARPPPRRRPRCRR